MQIMYPMYMLLIANMNLVLTGGDNIFNSFPQEQVHILLPVLLPLL